ncbi:hypothetical protein D6D19_02847 [Aureobasidium pullulans]|uniref:Tubulin-specific chaperone A n=2 Tax=Aureobasidium pullulans TaxID=5580 RepID=A0A4S9ABU3_AURPU|nr:hypothetical protein D6D22_06257 [Aureobasidium pullulans]THW76778.1 hypothetical protein D6D19_02847 [Aureobasidium pullulans]THX19239.1 hypothetical protein D6D17_01470 [Aureobasidium pullulans]THY18243.1 hypothetical protein D6D00_08192 [Aureobasidium pullulans]THZ30342.1 hypothetical protein D6C89_01502 [Aureobasidium pullulans]
MAPPSQLAIATSAVNRLVKEEASYHKELEHQQVRIEKLKQASSDEENAEWNLKQENRALEETKAMFPQLRKRIQESLAKLEQQLEQGEQNNPEEITKAKEAVASASTAIRETS